MLRLIFGPKEEDGWRRLHNEEFYGLYSSLDIIRLIKPLRMKWAGNVALMGDRTGACTVLVRTTY